MIRLVTKSVTEHLANSWKFVLAGKTEDHSEQTVELRTFHTLTKQEYVLGEFLFVGCLCQI